MECDFQAVERVSKGVRGFRGVSWGFVGFSPSLSTPHSFPGAGTLFFRCHRFQLCHGDCVCVLY